MLEHKREEAKRAHSFSKKDVLFSINENSVSGASGSESNQSMSNGSNQSSNSDHSAGSQPSLDGSSDEESVKSNLSDDDDHEMSNRGRRPQEEEKEEEDPEEVQQVVEDDNLSNGSSELTCDLSPQEISENPLDLPNSAPTLLSKDTKFAVEERRVQGRIFVPLPEPQPEAME